MEPYMLILKWDIDGKFITVMHTILENVEAAIRIGLPWSNNIDSQ